ncbi:NAD(P)H-hydrate dehydratase, partial [Candidatus Bathyarchaeota archaeon]|nr:NAD(P)H-hydrate dehydratase [Candidatus Bathyarchaeota archaeon]
KRIPVGKKVAIICGLGGNGGDGFVAARHLSKKFKVQVFLVGSSTNIRSEEAKINWNIIQNMRSSIEIQELKDSTLIKPFDADVIVDALLGTGLKGALEPPLSNAIMMMNRSKGFKVAIDVPTGVDSDSGDIKGEGFKADLTVTIHKNKIGFKNAEKYLGEVIIKPIGIPLEAELFTGPGDVYLTNKPRPKNAHKGDFGYVLVIGGSETYSGAPALTGMGAYATGVDLVYVAAPETASTIIAGFSPAFVTVKLKGSRLTMKNLTQLQPFLNRVNSVAMGPGLGTSEGTIEAVNALIDLVDEKNLPMLIDADALKSYATRVRKFKAPTVLTPHSEEFRTLTGKKVIGDYRERGETVQKEAEKMNATILLKGEVDIISDGHRTRYNWTGNPGMTVGGTGDVLSGIVVGFMAMGFDPFESSSAGAFINGVAGDEVFKEKGYHVLPTDLIDKIPKIIEDALSGKICKKV